MLTIEEERGLVQRLAVGDPEAREALVFAHLGLVKSIAWQVCRAYGSWHLIADIEGEGTKALIEAIDRFDMSYETRICTLAYARIKGEMRNYLDRRLVHFPRAVRDLAREVPKVQRQLEQALGQMPTPSDIACALNTGIHEVESALMCLEFCSERLETLCDAEQAEVASRYECQDRQHAEQRINMAIDVESATEQLSDQVQQTVIRLRFWEERSLDEIADTLGVSLSTVSRLLKQALGCLREKLEGTVEA